jgi:hypothetical protein
MRPIEFALMVDWEDGKPAEFIPATDVRHAEEMALRLYPSQSTWTVARDSDSSPWRYVCQTVTLSSIVADYANQPGRVIEH